MPTEETTKPVKIKLGFRVPGTDSNMCDRCAKRNQCGMFALLETLPDENALAFEALCYYYEPEEEIR